MSLKNTFTWSLCLTLVVSTLCSDASAIQSTRTSHPPRVAEVSRLIAKLGTGKDAAIAVRLRDKSVVSGYIDQADRDSLVVVDPKTGEPSTVSYESITRLQGYNLVSGVEVHKGTGIRGKLAQIATIITPHQRVQQNNLTKTHAVIIGVIIGILIAIIVGKTV